MLLGPGAAAIDAETDCGDSALHLAAARGYAEVVGLLMDNEADPCELNDAGFSAFHMAIVCRRPAVIKALMQRGVGTSDKTASGLTALGLARAEGAAPEVMEPLGLGTKASPLRRKETADWHVEQRAAARASPRAASTRSAESHGYEYEDRAEDADWKRHSVRSGSVEFSAPVGSPLHRSPPPNTPQARAQQKAERAQQRKEEKALKKEQKREAKAQRREQLVEDLRRKSIRRSLRRQGGDPDPAAAPAESPRSALRTSTKKNTPSRVSAPEESPRSALRTSTKKKTPSRVSFAPDMAMDDPVGGEVATPVRLKPGLDVSPVPPGSQRRDKGAVPLVGNALLQGTEAPAPADVAGGTRTVEVEKSPSGFDFKLTKDSAGRMRVVDTTPFGAADKAGVAIGEHVIAINGVAMETMSASSAAELLQSVTGRRIFIVSFRGGGHCPPRSRRSRASRRCWRRARNG